MTSAVVRSLCEMRFWDLIFFKLMFVMMLVDDHDYGVDEYVCVYIDGE